MRVKIKRPVVSAGILGSVIFVCVLVDLVLPGDAARMHFDALLLPPDAKFFFGTDSLGRDIFRMILSGGRISLFIGLLATSLAALIAVVYGAAAGLAPGWFDHLLMRVTDLIMSIPSILYVAAIQAVLGKPTLLSLAVVIGATSWMSIAKLVRTEVRQVHKSEYIVSARLMGAGFPYVLRQHLLPNFMPSIMFMLVHNVGQAIAAEATLSFLGLGMPPDSASWGALMNQAQDALLTNSWWVILFPSAFLITTLVCLTNIGEYFRGK